MAIPPDFKLTKEDIKKIIKHCGGVSKTQLLLRLKSRSAVTNWVSREYIPPANRHRLELLRPEIFFELWKEKKSIVKG